MSPTALSLCLLRDSGYQADPVERFIPEVTEKRDWLGCVDVIAVHPYRQPHFVAVQATSLANLSTRVAKCKSRPGCRAWIRAGGVFECHGWVQRGGRWEVKRIEIAGEDLESVPVEIPPRRSRRLKTPDLFPQEV